MVIIILGEKGAGHHPSSESSTIVMYIGHLLAVAAMALRSVYIMNKKL